MIFAASLLTAIAAYAAVGQLTGNPVRPWPQRMARPDVSRGRLWLTQAGSRLTIPQFLALSAGAGFVALVMVTAVTGAWWIAAVPAVAASLLPQIYYTRRRYERLRQLRQAWPDALRDLLASIAAGSTLLSALYDLSDRGPAPLRPAFARFRLMSRMVGLVPALEMTKEELGDPVSDRVVEVLVLAYEHGGGLVAEVLRDLVGEITEDLRLDAEIRSDGTEQRIESWVVLIIPWLLLVFLSTSSEEYRAYYRSADGLIVVTLAVVWSLLGVLLMKRISRSVSEHRVLARSVPGGEPGGES